MNLINYSLNPHLRYNVASPPTSTVSVWKFQSKNKWFYFTWETFKREELVNNATFCLCAFPCIYLHRKI